MSNVYFIYIMTNFTNTVLYTGVTNNLIRRVDEHKEKSRSGFTERYKIIKLIYYEVFEDINAAIAREKQIKAGSRKKKLNLIKKINPLFNDLYFQINQ